jgi:hypothetical protein
MDPNDCPLTVCQHSVCESPHSAPQLKRHSLDRVMAIRDLCRITVTVIALAVGPHSGLAQTRSGSLDTVWVMDGCATGRAFQVTLLLAKNAIYKALYRTTITVCQRERSQIPQKHWPFSFKPLTRLVFSTDSAGPDESVVGDIWQAGGESDAFVLGVSLESQNRILVNALHVASASTPSRTPVGDGIFVETLPTPPRGPGPQRRP